MKTNFNSEYLNNLAATITKEDEVFVDISSAISWKILDYLKKENISKKEFANILGKKNSQVSEWFGGGHNFTIATLAKITAHFPIDFSDCFKVAITHGKENKRPSKPAKPKADNLVYNRL
ncbi:MAG: helix-turn-helix domain-containing protein [Ignavibacteriaceae bacterium]|nr:helix-turn-helix domain-containing protein [Ignavibacteriaceae bacterium]